MDSSAPARPSPLAFGHPTPPLLPLEHGVRLRKEPVHAGPRGPAPPPLGLGRSPGHELPPGVDLAWFPHPRFPPGGPPLPHRAHPGLRGPPVRRAFPLFCPPFPLRGQRRRGGTPQDPHRPARWGLFERAVWPASVPWAGPRGAGRPRPQRHDRHHGKPAVPRGLPLLPRLSGADSFAGPKGLDTRGARCGLQLRCDASYPADRRPFGAGRGPRLLRLWGGLLAGEGP